MGSNKDDDSKSLSEKAKSDLKKEVKSYQVSEAKWNTERSIFDKLPDHEKPFPIEPFPHERQRLPFKMTDEDRMRRKVYLESQELTDREPIRSEELERIMYNPIRRFYRLPTDRFFNALAPVLGAHRVPLFRYLIPKAIMGYILLCTAWYNIKYNQEVNKHFKH